MPDFINDAFRQQFADMADRLARAEQKLDSINGPGVSNDSHTITINPPTPEPQEPPPQDDVELPAPQEQYTYYRGIGNNKAGFAPEVCHPPLT